MSKTSVLIGVAGGTGSGKTTVANEILRAVGAHNVAYIPHDAYYRDIRHLPTHLTDRLNFDHPDSLETGLLVDHLRTLKAGQAVEVPVYDFTTHTRTDKVTIIDPTPIVLVEGILVFAEPTLREMLDVKIYVDTDADVRFIRRLRRDIQERGRSVESVCEQYLATVKPMHEEFVEPSKRYADIIVPEGGYNPVAIEVIAARIRSMLEERS